MGVRPGGSEPTAKYTTQISPHMTIHQNKILPEIWILLL